MTNGGVRVGGWSSVILFLQPIVAGESSHHTNGSKAPRPTHLMLCDMIVSFMLGGMLVIM